MRRSGSNALLVAGSLVVTLCVLEVLARLLFPEYADSSRYLDTAFVRLLNSSVVFDPHSENYSSSFGYRLSPLAKNTESTRAFTYTSTTNSLGFRTKELGPRRPGEHRVLLIGDSMLWGLGVDDSSTISAALEALGSPTLSVYDYSVPGYNTVQESLVEETYIDSVQPDHVVLGFFIANDILPNLLVSPDSTGVLTTVQQEVTRLKADLREQLGPFYFSTVYRIVSLRVYVPRIRYTLSMRPQVLARSCDLIQRCAQVAGAHGSRFSVVLIYPRDAISGGLVERWSGSRRVGGAIASWCGANRIQLLDLLTLMNTPAQTAEYFFKGEGHFTASGNRFVAESIYRMLLEPRL